MTSSRASEIRSMSRVAAIIIPLVLFAGHLHAAEGSVAIGSVAGPTGAQVGYAIERALTGKAQVVPNLKYEAKARELGVQPGDPAGAAQVGRALGVDAVLIGSVTRDGRVWKTQIDLVEVGRGAVGASWVFDSPQLRQLSKIASRQAWVELAPGIRQAAANAGAAPPPVAAAPSAAPAAPQASDEVKVVLMTFGGERRGAALRKYMGAGMSGNPRITFLNAEQAAQQAQTIGVTLDDPVGRLATAELLKVNAFISGTVFKKGEYNYAIVEVHEGRTGEPIETLKLRRRYVKSLGAALAERAIPLVLNARGPLPPPPPEPPSAPEAQVAANEASPDQSASARPEKERKPRGPDARTQSPLRFGLGFNSFFREFSFNDVAVNDGAFARPYSSSFSPAIALDLEWFPAGHFVSEGVARHIGIGLEFDYAFGLSSRDEVNPGEPLEFPTNSFQFLGSVLARLPLGPSELGAEVGYGTDRFSLDATEDGTDAQSPNVEYEFLRLGGWGRARIAPQVDLGFRGGYRIVTGAGEFSSEDWFPNASIGAFDAEISLGTPLWDPVNLELGANYLRYFSSLNPTTDDPTVLGGTVAGGTLDEYTTAFLRVVLVL